MGDLLNNDNPFLKALLIKFIHLNCPLFRLHQSVSNRFVSTKIDDKRDDFDFGIEIVPFLDVDALHPFIDYEANHNRHLKLLSFIKELTLLN